MSKETTDPRGSNTDIRDPTRNALGHWDGCPYWDWRDFSKCQCEDGLACITESTIHTVSPMPLRDFFAATVNLPWQAAVDAAVDGSKLSRPTLAEVIEIRARMRYIEADAMLRARSLPDKPVDEDEVTD